MAGRTTFAALIVCAAAALACTRGPLPEESANAEGRPRILEGGTERPTKLLFGVTPFAAHEAMRREYAALAEYIQAKVGIPVELVVPDDYGTLTSDLARYRIHMALLSPLAYVNAKEQNPGIILLASMIADGSASYAGYLVVRSDSEVQTLADLRGKVFGFPDTESTSGYLYPRAHLVAQGIDPRSFFSRMVTTGNHDRTLDLITEGAIDVGGTYANAMRPREGDLGGAPKWRIVAKTGRIPYDAFCASPRLDQSLVESVRATLLALDTRTEEGRRVLGGRMLMNGFVVAGDDHYDEVRRTRRLVEDKLREAPAPQTAP